MHNPPKLGFIGAVRAGDNITVTQDALGYTVTGSASGGGGSGSLVYSNTSVPAGNTVANTASETAFTSSYDILADTLVVGDVIRIKLFGVYGTDAILAPTIRGKVKLDSTIMLDTGAVTAIVGITDGGWWAEGVFVVQTIGATGTIEAQGYAEFATAATTGLSVNTENTSAITIDTTVDQTLSVTVQWGAADTDNTITLREMTVYHDAVVDALSRGYPQGTSFPGSPSTDDKFYRTDRNLLYFYDGTRWLTVQQYTIPFTTRWTATPPTTAITATTANIIIAGCVFTPTYDFWAETFTWDAFVATTNDGTKFWSATLKTQTSAAVQTTLGTPITTAANAPNLSFRYNQVINALIGTTAVLFVVDVTKTSTPGGLNFYSGAVIGRLVG